VINVLLWLPLAIGLVGCLLPGRRSAAFAGTAGALATLGLAIWLLADFQTGTAAVQHTVNEEWIPELGVRYQLGVTGISIFMVVLTAVLWFATTVFSATKTDIDRPKVYYLMLALGETATLGVFLAQDLLLFVLFFDLLLIPFYFLIGGWGEAKEDENGRMIEPREATIKMIIYTLVGSLLMLAAAIATAVLSADGGDISFSLADLQANLLGEGSQDWIFWFFAAAFLVKMPAFPLQGWMPDVYRTAPLPVLAVFSGVLSKVGAYGFIAIVLPLFPDAVAKFQLTILILGLVSILYGSIMAFTQWNARLVAGYSSIAQLGFITIGIFSLRSDGIDGAVLQMVNHGIVVAPLFLILAVIAVRSGTDDLRKMGGMAFKAPVLAVLFIIVTLGVLAMPGTANFIGELYILYGVFESKIAIAIIASVGVAMAAYYALRLFQHVMHNRLPDGVESREICKWQGAILAGLVACILGLALHPQFVLKHVDDSASLAANDLCWATVVASNEVGLPQSGIPDALKNGDQTIYGPCDEITELIHP
jgi:NADH-quinone oxidoreductase subunit M